MTFVNQLSLWDVVPQEPAPSFPKVALASVLNDLHFDARSIFDAMSVAEAEINQAMIQYPDQRYLIYGAFLTLRPMFQMPIKAYEYHCRELLWRIAYEQPLDPPTQGEIIAFLIECAFTIPLHNQPAALLSKLFQEALPDQSFDGLNMLSERYEGETDSLLRELQDRLKFTRAIPVTRTPLHELLQIESDNGYPAGWADEQNVLEVRLAREANP